MITERVRGGTCKSPFPIYEDLVTRLVAAHGSANPERDPVVAHALATCSGYAYSDIDTMATIATRLGFEEHACVRIAQSVDTMFVSSVAYLTQSRCGRLVVLSYRGTGVTDLSAWLGDVDVGSDSMAIGDGRLRVHSGFYRNVRSSRLEVLHELELALQGRSLLDGETKVDHAMEALYVTGHSLGGGLAVVLALSLAAGPEHAAIAERLRAVYTFGQPLATGEPLPEAARDVAAKVFRHVMAHDLIPHLPARSWGDLAHLGREYRYTTGKWRHSETPSIQMKNSREASRALLGLFVSPQRTTARYTLAEHGPHHYISALRPEGSVTEFGDRA